MLLHISFTFVSHQRCKPVLKHTQQGPREACSTLKLVLHRQCGSNVAYACPCTVLRCAAAVLHPAVQHAGGCTCGENCKTTWQHGCTRLPSRVPDCICIFHMARQQLVGITACVQPWQIAPADTDSDQLHTQHRAPMQSADCRTPQQDELLCSSVLGHVLYKAGAPTERMRCCTMQ